MGSFAKVRGSWAQVGNDTSPYYINSGYSVATYQRGDKKIYGMTIPENMKSTNLNLNVRMLGKWDLTGVSLTVGLG